MKITVIEKKLYILGKEGRPGHDGRKGKYSYIFMRNLLFFYQITTLNANLCHTGKRKSLIDQGNTPSWVAS